MKKPVKKFSVVVCLILVLAVISTLFLPVFSINLAPHAQVSEHINVTGLDMLRALFDNGANYSEASAPLQALLDFLGKGVADLTQYINPIFANIMLSVYVAVLVLTVIMLIVTFINMAGYRLSVFNVFSGLLTMICGIVMCICVPLQNAEYVTNAVIYYDFRLSFGAIMIVFIGFLFICFFIS